MRCPKQDVDAHRMLKYENHLLFNVYLIKAIETLKNINDADQMMQTKEN